ncbi:MAG: ribulose-phosphate 3-epimerase [Clostridia bacterium]|nr:ribulose-phosphate 3-epimerase [Clostridia bacterium]
MIKIYPSLLAADFYDLKKEIKDIEAADGMHIDVMDGHFVNNITIGVPVIKSIRKHTTKFLDVHLMIENPLEYIKVFSFAGADSITFHLEVADDPLFVIEAIKCMRNKVGVSIKPETDVPDLSVLKAVDSVLVMSVEPGFGGQEYIETTDEKIKKLAMIKKENNLNFEIAVDGGINLTNAKRVIECGADVLIAGSAIFNEKNRKKAINKMRG